MKMIYVAALMAGTALVPANAFGQQTPAAANTETNGASQAQQADPVMNGVQPLIERALQAIDNNDLQAANEAVQEASRQLDQHTQTQGGERDETLAGIREPLQEAEQALAEEDAQRAREALGRVEQQMANLGNNSENAQDGTDLVVEDTAAIEVEVPEPNVTVQQANPRVAVQQQQPEITVHQPAPTVTVDIPQPQITVRMPEPDVQVSQSQPQIQVEQAQPQVRVSENEPQVRMQGGEDQANVQVERSGEPVVEMQSAEQEANIQYTAEEAQVRVNRAEGEPEVSFEQQAENNQNVANRQAQGQTGENAAVEQQARVEDSHSIDQQQTGAISQSEARDDVNMAIAPGSSSEVSLTVAEIKDYDIVGADANDLGDIEEVVNVDNRLYAVVTSGGFLGLGENRAAVPLSALHVTDQGTLQAPNVTERQIEGMENFESDRYQALPDDHPVTLGAR